MTGRGTCKYIRLPRYDSHMMMMSAADFELYRPLTPTYVHVFCSVSHSHLLWGKGLSDEGR